MTLSCSSDSNPPADISWFKGGTYLKFGQTYRILKFSSGHNGEYRCKSRNKQGEKYSDAVALIVMCELMIICTLFKVFSYLL